MYKIKYLATGHIFELPDKTAQELKTNFPDEYKIIEKNGKKFNDKINKKIKTDSKNIYSLVVES